MRNECSFCRILVYTESPPPKNVALSFEQIWPLRVLCAKFGWNLPGGFKVHKLFSISCYLHPLEKGKIESPCSKGVLCRDWLSITQWFLSRRCLKVSSLFPLFLQKKIFFKIYSMYFRYFFLNPLKRGLCLISNKLESTTHKYPLRWVLVIEIGLVVIEQKTKIWNGHAIDDRQRHISIRAELNILSLKCISCRDDILRAMEVVDVCIKLRK